MLTSIEALEAQILNLPKQDRSRLLDKLIASLDADPELEAAWDAVADERERALEVGTAHTVPLEVALKRLEARFKA